MDRNSGAKIDAILIDNDKATHGIWRLCAKAVDKHFAGFVSSTEFFEKADMLNKDIPVYVDFDLGEVESGDLIARRIKQLGFETIYIQTAHECADSLKPEWITAIIGKKTPWDEDLGLRSVLDGREMENVINGQDHV